MRVLLSAALGLAISLTALQPVAATEITVLYSWGSRTTEMESLTKAFMAKHPDITINLRAAAKDYEEAHAAVLRGAVTSQLPDVHFPGFTRFLELAETAIPVKLETLGVTRDALVEDGYVPALLDLTSRAGLALRPALHHRHADRLLQPRSR